MTSNTNSLDYWLNWRFLVCAIWILVAIVLSALLIWRYEGRKMSKKNQRNEEDEGECLEDDETLRTCSKSIDPVWLLAYRIVAFCFLLASLLADAVIHSGRIFYFYTQWTYTLVAIYFGLGSAISLHRCLCNGHQRLVERYNNAYRDSERGSYTAPKLGEDTDVPHMNGSLNEFVKRKCRIAFVWGYVLQIIFQICAGAVALTDSVFWLVIYTTVKDYTLSFLVVCLHSVNAVLLLGEALLNNLRFPFFRIAYFVLWTCIFVIFQWIVHACVSIRWPYPFLDLSSPYAPIWYLALALLHGPCFGFFALVFRIKQCYVAR